MRPIRINIDLADVDADGVFQNQTLGGAGTITLNGAEVVGGQWVTPDGFAKQIGLVSAGNISTVTFTITGYQDYDRHVAITDTVTGINNSTVETTKYFYYITSIAADGAVGSNVAGGAVDEAITAAIPLNWRGDIVSVNADITGTVNATIQQTFDNLQNLNDLDFAWQDSPSASLVGFTASTNDAYDGIPSALRCKINSYSSGAAISLTINSRDR